MYHYAHGGHAAPNLLDFSANINPLGLPKGVREAIIAALDSITAYPDPFCTKLTHALAAREEVSPAWVLCANGASDLLFRLAALHPASAGLVTAPCFNDYPRALEAASSRVDAFMLERKDGFAITNAYAQALKPCHRIVFLCNPNNPTGTLTDTDTIRTLLVRARAQDTLVVIDECFLDLTTAPQLSAIPFLKDFPNLVIVKALTKSHALPGLRIGYALSSNEKTLDRLRFIAPDWSVSALAQAGGLAALADEAHVQNAVALIEGERARMRTAFLSLGLECAASRANFLFFHASDAALDQKLLEKGICIRNCSSIPGLWQGDFRVAVKLPHENDALITALRAIIGKEA